LQRSRFQQKVVPPYWHRQQSWTQVGRRQDFSAGYYSPMTTGFRQSAIPLSPAAGFLEHHGHGHSAVNPEVLEDGAADFEQQCETAYGLLREGYTELEVISELRKAYGRGCPAVRAYRAALEALVEEQRSARAFAPELMAAARQRAIRVGLATGQVAAVAALLRDTENSLGVASEELATLKVEVMEPGKYAPINRLPGEPITVAQESDS